jgi:succinate dehydrogenase/fumarate reductase flavoprotein subunit
MNSTKLKKINTDISVIGGGAAGIRAAIEANEQGANVLIVVKGNFCETGSTFYLLSPGWGMQVSFGYVATDDSSNEHLKEILNAGIQNLLQLGLIVANAASIRKESRGSHYRSDFPYTDDDHFSRSILIRKEGTQIKYKWETLAC